MIVKTESTLDFIGNWSAGTESFAIDTPNPIVVVDESEKQDTPIIELFNPIYDLEKKKLK